MREIEFADSDYYTGPPLTDEMVEAAERRLGVKLPAAYVDLLRIRNGGAPLRRCVPTPFATSWAPDHFAISGILGIGDYDWGIDDPTFGSAYMVAEWGYPEVGVVICSTPSGGHDTVMLDYTTGGEPAVVYVDEWEPRVAQRIADSFAEFLDKLVACPDVGEPIAG